jgi:dTDP-4-dehydrorhamnose reductase
MLGHTLFMAMRASESNMAYGTLRGRTNPFTGRDVEPSDHLFCDVDITKTDSVVSVLSQINPDVVVNCVGLIKQRREAENRLHSMEVNAMFPHRLSALCALAKARLVHVSTDCVFQGSKGNYTETDVSDATDTYGRTKYLGEVCENHCVTLRTSIIGHELKRKTGLLEWFLNQGTAVNGFVNAVFTGLTTNELSRVIINYVIPNMALSGLFHVSAGTISKCELLRLLAATYGSKVEIRPSIHPMVDRSLDSSKFRDATGYMPPSWPTMVADMHHEHVCSARISNCEG